MADCRSPRRTRHAGGGRRSDRRTPPGIPAPNERAAARRRWRRPPRDNGSRLRSGRALRPVNAASDSDPNAEGGAGSTASANHAAHHRCAIRFQRDNADERPVRSANARSFARTCATVSFGVVSSANRIGSASRSAWAIGSSPNSGKRRKRTRAAVGQMAVCHKCASQVPNRLSPTCRR